MVNSLDDGQKGRTPQRQPSVVLAEIPVVMYVEIQTFRIQGIELTKLVTKALHCREVMSAMRTLVKKSSPVLPGV